MLGSKTKLGNIDGSCLDEVYGNAFGLFDSNGMFVGLGGGGFAVCACDGLKALLKELATSIS